jgi:hypothetical protein
MLERVDEHLYRAFSGEQGAELRHATTVDAWRDVAAGHVLG